MSSRLRVVVLGAGGELGARVCRLVERAHGLEVLGASRSARGPRDVAMQRADVTDGASVVGLLRAGDLVVNCVGPFQYDPLPLVAACVSARAHYCDLADDVAFAERVREAAQRAGALAQGSFVCTGASTVPGLAGVLARALARSPRASEIARVAVYLSVGSRNPLSASLLASLLAPLGRPLPGGARCFAAQSTLRASDGRTLRFGSYPAPFRGGRLEVGSRPTLARFAFGFDRASLTALLRLAAPLLGRIDPGALRHISRALLPLARAASAVGTRRGVLAVVGESGSGQELERIELAARERGLDIPAAPAAWIAARLARGDAAPAGAVELHELVSIEDVISWAHGNAAYALSASIAL